MIYNTVQITEYEKGYQCGLKTGEGYGRASRTIEIDQLRTDLAASQAAVRELCDQLKAAGQIIQGEETQINWARNKRFCSCIDALLAKHAPTATQGRAG